jgi:hypothetical protein
MEGELGVVRLLVVICTALPARGDGGIRQKLKDAACTGHPLQG